MAVVRVAGVSTISMDPAVSNTTTDNNGEVARVVRTGEEARTITEVSRTTDTKVVRVAMDVNMISKAVPAMKDNIAAWEILVLP